MKRLSLLAMMISVGCGSTEGNWNGTCENPATGEARTFDLDIDTDDRDGIAGSAFMTINTSSGDKLTIACTVTGEMIGGEADLDFVCDDDSEFSIDFTKDGGDLVGYCDSAEEVELRLVQD